MKSGSTRTQGYPAGGVDAGLKESFQRKVWIGAPPLVTPVLFESSFLEDKSKRDWNRAQMIGRDDFQTEKSAFSTEHIQSISRHGS